MNYQHYRPVVPFSYPGRTWPSASITKAPRWCSSDLRDGNQALAQPMSIAEKKEFFNMLVKLGFREIEVGFPAASQTEFNFLRMLAEPGTVPDDVYIQVITQCREDQIRRTMEAVRGIRRVIFNIYNSVSDAQRDAVFHKDAGSIRHIATRAAALVQELRWEEEFDEFILEYTAESFTGADPGFSLGICENVIRIWQPSEQNPMIITLPATVEDHTPNGYADMIEWMNDHLPEREHITLCIHPHNDRGTAVAAAEMGLLAGAERVEGTLFGNGERTGNADIFILACNMMSMGIDPGLDFSNEPQVQSVYERCTGMTVPDRHPYAGKLVYTAFAGSHQDAINKGLHRMEREQLSVWQVPYLSIDPADIGRSYEPLIRINSQSGKGGVAFIMESFFGYKLPKEMHGEFARSIQKLSEGRGEITPEEIRDAFLDTYVNVREPLEFINIGIVDTAFDHGERQTLVNIRLKYHGEEHLIKGLGNGPIDAAQQAIEEMLGISFHLVDYTEHALTTGASSDAVAYVCVRDGKNGRTAFGAGISSNVMKASIRALIASINRAVYR